MRTHLKRVHQQTLDDIQMESRQGLASSTHTQVTSAGSSNREARQVSVLLQRDACLRVDSMSGLLTSADDVCMDDVQVGGGRDDDTHMPHLDDDDDDDNADLDESFLTE